MRRECEMLDSWEMWKVRAFKSSALIYDVRVSDVICQERKRNNVMKRDGKRKPLGQTLIVADSSF